MILLTQKSEAFDRFKKFKEYVENKKNQNSKHSALIEEESSHLLSSFGFVKKME